MEQHPVPQHIASFEFKLFGNLTVRQFVTLSIPLSIATIIFFSNLAPIIRLPISTIIGLFGFFIALVPLGGRPFDKWVVAFLKAIMSPTQRLWIKEQLIPDFLKVVISPPILEQKIPEAITAQGRERLMAYLRSLPTPGTSPLDLKEEIAIQRLGLELAKGEGEAGKLPPPIIWSRQSLPQISPIPATTLAQEYPEAMASSLPALETTVREAAPVMVAPHAKPYILPGLEKKLQKAVEILKLPRTQLASETNFALENIIPIQTPDRQIKLIPTVGKTRVRKLHFAPPEGFDLSKLPIRGERKFDVSEELKRRFHFPDETPPVILPAEPKKEIKTQVAPSGPKTSFVPKATRLVPRPTVNLKTPQGVSFKTPTKEIFDTQISVKGQKSPNVPLPQAALNRAQIVPLTNKPNVVSGIITDSTGSPVEGAVLVVRDQNGIPLRALKTNKLGQFLSATSLASGTYSIEVESDLASFVPITITLSDQVLAPLEIKAQGGQSA